MHRTDDKRWDAIVIGSGIGGMAAAAALSKVGHKVLLLEQYQTLGGLTHSFTIGGFTWAAGIHYLSGIAPGDPMRDLLDWLADTPIELTSMGAIYDNLHIAGAAPLALSRPFEAQERDLKDRFPDEAEAIEAWTAALREGREAINKILPTSAMPELLGSVLHWWHGRAIDRWCRRTTQEVMVATAAAEMIAIPTSATKPIVAIIVPPSVHPESGPRAGPVPRPTCQPPKDPSKRPSRPREIRQRTWTAPV
jgi:all-trans-retinol 13,14-reductase